MLKNIIRALRLAFASASALPFIFGSFVERTGFNLPAFLMGLVAVVSAHLSANLINDYADSRSGNDWQDKKFYGLFGGSKLIQEGVYPEGFYLNSAILFAAISCGSVLLLALILKSGLVIGLFFCIILLAWSYSAWPLRLSYRRLGEFVVFFLFGPVPVMAGYFIQTGVFPDLKSFQLSFPFGFLTTAILFSNEIPDFVEDKRAGKLTWVSLFGRKHAYLAYGLLIALAFFTISINVFLGYLKSWGLFSFILIIPGLKAAKILRDFPTDKIKLIESSKLTIAVQALTGLILILTALL
ncbi:MAG: prenyltransferase [Candidatus Omnitrophota bacterium]